LVDLRRTWKKYVVPLAACVRVKVEFIEKKRARYALELGVGQGEVFESVRGKRTEDLEPELIGNLFSQTHGKR
jgi:hypothetical protein